MGVLNTFFVRGVGNSPIKKIARGFCRGLELTDTKNDVGVFDLHARDASECQKSLGEKSLNKRKCRSARKIPPCGKWHLGGIFREERHLLLFKATFHLTIFVRGERATGKIQRNNCHHGSCGSSLTCETSSVSLIFTHGTHRNVKNR